MKISFFDTHSFEKPIFVSQNKSYDFDIDFIDTRLDSTTALLASGSQAVCSFVNDKIDEACIDQLSRIGVRLIALRCAGFNHVDLQAAQKKDITVCRVPGYSPHSVAEYTIGLLLCLNRKIHKSYLRVRELDFSLKGLVGFDLYGKTVGVLGTGKIGSLVAQILAAFGCNVLCCDEFPSAQLSTNPNIKYVDLKTLAKESDVISLHVPLTPQTHHMVDQKMLSDTKPGVYIINTGRGALIDSKALIKALKSGHIGGAALDVYEEEEAVFFKNVSDQILQDDTLARLLTFPNVLISSHQAFLTKEALENIADTTLKNMSQFDQTASVAVDALVTAANCIK